MKALARFAGCCALAVSQPEKPSQPLRFQTGAQVECKVGNAYKQGTVTRQWHYQPSVKREVPYEIKLEDGSLIFAPDDTNNFCRVQLRFEVGKRVECYRGTRGWVQGTVTMQWKFLEETKSEMPYEVKLDGGELLHAPEDTDAFCREFTGMLRFAVGKDVECYKDQGWKKGKVVQHWFYEEALQNKVPYQVELDSGESISVPDDSDAYCRDPSAPSLSPPKYERPQHPEELRFGIGKKVECYMGSKGWMQGNVVAQWKYVDELQDKVPYEVKLDSGVVIHAPEDTDAICREFTGKVRFGLGTAVECYMGKEKGWKTGKVHQHWFLEQSLSKKVPYQVALDTGELIPVPEDTDAFCKTPGTKSANQEL